MAYLPLVNVVPQFFDSLGDPLVGGTLNAYVAGTSTPTNMYSDNIGTVAGTSVTLDSRGEPTTIKLIWVDTDISYKFVLKDSSGTTIWTEDNIQVTSITNGSVTEDKIASGAVTASKIASNAVTTSKIVDSNITTAKIANTAITPEKMQNSGYECGRKNKIINGDMLVKQRSGVFSSVGNVYTIDRWRIQKSTSAVCEVQRSSLGTKPNNEFQYAIQFYINTADTSIASGDYAIIEQRIEDADVYDLDQATFTLSFWVYSTKTGTYCASFRNWSIASTRLSYVKEFTINQANTWEFKTITVTGGLPSSFAGTDLYVGFTLASGTTYQTTANAWQTGEFFGTSNQVNFLDASANFIRITGVQLERGISNTTFEHLPYVESLALCQRYYEEGTISSFRLATNTTPSRGYAVTKRTAPTFTLTPASGTGGTVAAAINGFSQITAHSAEVAASWIADAEL